MATDFRGTKVLMLGLGLLGGGAATVNWLLDHGAEVTVADRRNKDALEPSVRRVLTHLRRTSREGVEFEERVARLTWSLGCESADLLNGVALLVVNPAIPDDHPLIEESKVRGIRITNEANLFYDSWRGTTVGVTGTRGKTTSVRWANHLIPRSAAVGNSPESPFLSPLGLRLPRVVVTELPSFLLERFEHAPKVAVITNLYRDHLDRHETMEEYARTKAAVFTRQKSGDTVILNADDSWTPHFLSRTHLADIQVFSRRPLPPGRAGIWNADGAFWQRMGKSARRVLTIPASVQARGQHNLDNLMAAVLAARAVGVSWGEMQRRLRTLPEVPFRQEVVLKSGKLTVVNDTAATSPDGGIAALMRWGGSSCVLICGGTDRRLDYGPWADVVRERIPSGNLVFLPGTATLKMKGALSTFARGVRTYETLAQCVSAALTRAGQFVTSTILFSPAAKSFGTFTDEYDRGRQFNELVADIRKR